MANPTKYSSDPNMNFPEVDFPKTESEWNNSECLLKFENFANDATFTYKGTIPASNGIYYNKIIVQSREIYTSTPKISMNVWEKGSEAFVAPSELISVRSWEVYNPISENEYIDGDKLLWTKRTYYGNNDVRNYPSLVIHVKAFYPERDAIGLGI